MLQCGLGWFDVAVLLDERPEIVECSIFTFTGVQRPESFCVLEQASYCMQHQIQLISHLDDTDRKIRAEKSSTEYLKRLKESRTIHREDLIECVRQCTW